MQYKIEMECGGREDGKVRKGRWVTLAESEEEVAGSVRANQFYSNGELQDKKNPKAKYQRTTIHVVSDGILNVALKLKTSSGLNPCVNKKKKMMF